MITMQSTSHKILRTFWLRGCWLCFYTHFKADLKLWCYFIVLQQISRLTFIVTLSNYLNTTTRVTTIIWAMLHGLRFDSLWSTVWISIPLLLITIPSIFINTQQFAETASNKIRYHLGRIFTVTTVLIYIISIEYFREYKDLFNQFLFNFFYDDQIAIFKTILSEHNILLYIVVLITTLILYGKYVHKLIISQPAVKNKLIFNNQNDYTTWQRIAITIGIILFYIIGFRGSIGPRPIQLKDAGVTCDPFLNKAIISPYSSLKYAIKEHLAIHSQKGHRYANISQQDIMELAKSFFHTTMEHEKLSEYMQKTTTGSLIPTPKHIFLIIGESLDAWPLQNEYNQFNLTPNLHTLMQNGLYLKYFLPCSSSTEGAVNTIITGLPDLKLHTNYQPNSYTPYPTALANQFKALGFKTQFFYGGYLSWQRLEDFVKNQGFDAVYGAAHISNWQQTNEWGVDDRTLFKFIDNNIQTTITPTFNIIMTTSNHPPFSIDLKKEGFDSDKTARLLASYPKTTTNIKELGHIWYADRTIGEFITNVTMRYPSTLFAITGDHFGRKHISPKPSLFDSSAVPLILYGNNIQNYYKFSPNTAGGHLDVGATLIELVAPKGFKYYAMGNNLFSRSKHSFGIGEEKIITTSFIVSTTSQEILYLQKPNKNIPNQQLDSLKQQHHQAMDIAWWMIKKGDLYAKNNH